VLQIVNIRGEIESAEYEKYERPLQEHLARREFRRALAESEKASERRDYRRAIELLKPYEEGKYVKESVESKLSELYRLKAEEALERAQYAVEIGEFQMARSILDSLEGDPVPDEQRTEQLELVERLNSEYALEEAVTASEKALQQDSFDLARKELAFLADDPHVGERAKAETARIDALEETWLVKERAKREIIVETVAREEETQTDQESPEPLAAFDTPPQLLSKIEPLYPDLLRQSNVSGFVELEWEIGVDGKARNVNVMSSSRSEFELPAKEAVQRWRFRPAQKDGRPVPAKVRQKLLFNPR